MAGTIDIEGLGGFIDESNESLQGIETDFIELEKDPNNMEIIDRIFRPVHSLKGNSGFFGLVNINKFAHRLENLLDFVRNGKIVASKEIVDILLSGIEYLQAMLDRAQVDPTDIELRSDEEEFIGLVEKQQPKAVLGTVQSVVELEKCLNDALEEGININDHSLIVSLLTTIEKSNKEIREIINSTTQPVEHFSAEMAYTLDDVDYTEHVSVFGEILATMKAQTAADMSLIKECGKKLKFFSETFSSNKSLCETIDELSSMINFLDDDMMIHNDDYLNTLAGQFGEIIAKFTAVPLGGKAERVGEILVEQKKISEEQLGDALNKQQKVGEILVNQGAIDKKDLDQALTIQDKKTLSSLEKERKKAAESPTKTIRIDQSKLDTFANFVGELFINIDAFNYLKKQLENSEADFELMSKFTNTVTSFDDMVEDLHESVMEIRRVPVKSLFQRFPKVIRQITNTIGKKVKFNIVGDDTVIDKDLLEKIENPLVHILRNSVDHGIEMPEVRQDSNKSEEGTLELKASADENSVYITVTDDGKGIDPAVMKRVALKKEFLSEAELAVLSEQELVNLIFKPGFSSAQKVSDISGRGVGMDVVMSGLRECKGTINVTSKINEGTKVFIKIPLTKTLVAKESMIVESSGRVYAIDSDDISTSIEADQKFIDLFAQDKCINHNGKVLQVVSADSFFFNGNSQVQMDRKDKQILIICEEYLLALLVDKVVSHQKIVVKDFSGSYQLLNKIKGISGYTILGNEDIALIMDVKGIAAHQAARGETADAIH